MSAPGLFGSSLPTSVIYAQIDELKKTPIQSERFKELLVSLFQNYIDIASIVNYKESSIYYTDTVNNPFTSGNTWFPTNPNFQTRDAIRVVVNFGVLPNTATKSVAHDIPFDSQYILTRLEAYATDPVGLEYIPIPYSGAANSIELNLDATNVNITTTTNRTAFTICYVVIEYLPF